jgi:hypothetical protein
VVAELFTSEGCSSCPSADGVLSTLIHDQPLPLVEVVGLGEHVDYWDHLGWRDPYSSPLFSARQSEYSTRAFRGGDIYTPQLVIDGQYEAVGSDIRAVRNAIVRAAASPRATVDIETAIPDAAHVSVRVRVQPQPSLNLVGRGDLTVALAQDRVVDDVARGENRGRRLAHSAVVRSLSTIASTAESDGAVTANVTLSLLPSWPVPDMRVVAFLQEHDSRRILGAASVSLDHLTHKEHTR